MTIIDLVRAATTLTFLLLLAEGIAAIVYGRRFVRRYLTRHRALEVRVEAIERRLQQYMEH